MPGQNRLNGILTSTVLGQSSRLAFTQESLERIPNLVFCFPKDRCFVCHFEDYPSFVCARQPEEFIEKPKGIKGTSTYSCTCLTCTVAHLGELDQCQGVDGFEFATSCQELTTRWENCSTIVLSESWQEFSFPVGKDDAPHISGRSIEHIKDTSQPFETKP